MVLLKKLRHLVGCLAGLDVDLHGIGKGRGCVGLQASSFTKGLSFHGPSLSRHFLVNGFAQSLQKMERTDVERCLRMFDNWNQDTAIIVES